MQKSFLISADVAHAIHPNYAHKHESKHAPRLNMGTVIKTNDNQRYATNSVTGFMIRELARAKDVPVQEFVVRVINHVVTCCNLLQRHSLLVEGIHVWLQSKWEDDICLVTE